MKRLISLFLAMVMVFSFCACAKKEETSQEETTTEETTVTSTFGLTPLDKETTLSIGFFAGSPHSMPWYIADKMGFFKELNIDVEYQSFTGGPAMMEASASWDVCDVGGPGVINGMKNKDINMIGICDNEQNTALFVRADSDIAKDPANPEVWRGKTVLLNRGTTLQYMFMSYMQSIGITDLDAYNITITDTAVGQCLTAFEAGTGDAMCVWNAFACTADDKGYVRVTDMGEMGLNNISGICSTADAIANKTDLVALAYQVYYLTWEWCNESSENMDKAVELYLDSCEEEGVAITEANARKMLAEEFNCRTLDEAVAEMTTMEADRDGQGGQVSKATNLLFETLDFFIGLGNYTADDRANFLSKGLVNPAIADLVK